MSESDAELRAFLTEHADWMLQVSSVIVRSSADAEDLAQDAFETVIRRWEAVKRSDNPKAYLRRVLVNTYLSSQRRFRNHRELLVGAHDVGFRDVDLSRVEDSQLVLQLLSPLPPKQRVAIALRFLEDCSFAEVSAALGCRESSARSLTKRGLDTLRARIQVQAPSPESQAEERILR